MTLRGAVVAAIDGSANAWQALQWAAEEAQLTDRSLVVAHVGDTEASTDAVDPGAFGRDLLDEAVAALAESHPTVSASTELLSGDPVEQLRALGRDAHLLVVGRGRRGLPGIRLGSVAFRLLAHTDVPTAVVPPAGAGGRRNAVVVGVSDTVGGAAALQFAFTECRERGAELIAARSWSVREWRLAAGAGLPLTSPEMWEAQERTVLDDCLRPWRDTCPDVPVHTVLSGAPVEMLLEEQAASAAMLVLGCRRGDDAHLPRLGPIASWAAHHFRCPVVVVGHPDGLRAGQETTALAGAEPS
jgi:nucleotide-binding universal stress UspA family protein